MAETLPVVNGSVGTWGTILNTAITNIDTRVATATTTNNTQDGDISSLKSRVSTLETNVGSGSASSVPNSAYAAKGDILVGTGAGSYTRLAAPNPGYVLQPFSSGSTGMTYQLNAGSIMLMARQTTSQPLSTASNTLLSFQVVDYDRMSGFGGGTTYTCQYPGWYELTGGCTFGSSNVGYRALYWYYGSQLLRGGSSTQASYSASATTTSVVARPTPVQLASGDQISLGAYHNHGSVLSTDVSTSLQATMCVKYLGPS